MRVSGDREEPHLQPDRLVRISFSLNIVKTNNNKGIN